MHEGIYRQKGSPEVDAAWEALGVDCKNYGITRLSCNLPLTVVPSADRAGVISLEEGLRSGLTSAHVQRSAKYGGGFFVNVEGLHHLHCLVSSNSIRCDSEQGLAASTICFKSQTSLRLDRISCESLCTLTTHDTKHLGLTHSQITTRSCGFMSVSHAKTWLPRLRIKNADAPQPTAWTH